MKTSNHGHPFKCVGQESWKHLLAFVLVYCFEELLRLQFFKCPCTNYTMYSLAMIAAPSLFLLGVGFCTSTNYWKVVHTRRNMINYKVLINYCLKSLPNLFEPFFPVSVFIVLVLLKGEYYACAMVGNSHACAKQKEIGSRILTTKPTDEFDRRTLYSQSQLLGCGVMAGVTIFAVGIIFIRSCFFVREGIPDSEEYYLLENKLLVESFREKLEESIEKEVKRDVEEAFKGVEEKGVEMVFKQAHDHIGYKKTLNQNGRFTRLNENGHCDEENSSVRIIDSSL